MRKADKIKKKRMRRQIAFIKRQTLAYWSRYRLTKKFLTHHPFGEYQSWADIYFPGKFMGKNVLWNCTISTTHSEFEGTVLERAIREISNKYPNRHLYDERGFHIIERMDNGRSRMKENPEWTDEVSKKYSEERTSVCKRIASEGLDIEIGYEVLDEFYFGVGLNIVVGDKWLTIDAVEKAVDEFNKLNISGYGPGPTDTVRLTEKDLEGYVSDESVHFPGW